MKEQLFEILHNRKRMPGERFSDIEGKIEELVNQEVERRIKEMMSDDEINAIAVKFAPPMMYYGVTGGEDVNLFIRRDVIEILVNLRSRLTPQVTPQDTPQVEKTEGNN